MAGRIGIDDVAPVVSAGRYPAKAVVGEVVPVRATVWREGHDAVAATLVVRYHGKDYPQLAEGRIVLDLGDERFWLLPRDLADRTLLFTMRHGISRVESKTHRVGRRLSNDLDQERGVPRADTGGSVEGRR